MIDQAGNQSYDIVDLVAGESAPAGGFAQMDAGLPRGGSADGVVRKDKRQSTITLVVGALVVHGGVADPAVTVGVDLGESDHPENVEVLSRLRHRHRADGVVAGAGHRVGHGHRGGHTVQSPGRATVPEAVEVGDPLMLGWCCCEGVEQGVPDRFRDRQHQPAPGTAHW